MKKFPHNSSESFLGVNRLNGSLDGRPWLHGPLAEAGEQVMPQTHFNSLLVPLDGSALAEHAIPHALAIARRSGATVRLVHVHSAEACIEPWQLYYRGSLLDRLRREKKAYLRNILHRVRAAQDVPVITRMVEDDEIEDSLACTSRGADLVVMATHRRGRLGRLWHGSVADTLMDRLSCPLLLVRGKDTPVDLTSDPIARHILVPLDGTPASSQILDPAAAIGLLSGAQFTLVNVSAAEPAGRGVASSDPKGYMVSAAASLRELLPGIEAGIATVGGGSANALQAYAEEQRVDLVAVTTPLHDGMARLTRRGLADLLLSQGKIPVLLERPSGVRALGR